MKKITVKDQNDLQIMFNAAKLFWEEKEKIDVFLKVFNPDRTVEQNALYWLWLKEISEQGEHGNTKDELHYFYKEKFLINIYIREFPDFAEMAKAVFTLKERDPDNYNIMRTFIINETSTTKCNVKLFREYLNDIQLHATRDFGCVLSEPSMKGIL